MPIFLHYFITLLFLLALKVFFAVCKMSFNNFFMLVVPLVNIFKDTFGRVDHFGLMGLVISTNFCGIFGNLRL